MTTQPGITGAKRLLSGWGCTPVEECLIYRPERAAEIAHILAHAPDTLVARGAGMSYGDASLNPPGVLLLERSDRFMTFDADKGLLTCEAGVTLKEILAFAVPRGWFLPVIPGTKNATIGGAFACNVHGKNAYAMGEFAEHVRSVAIRMADGGRVECSAQSDKELFWATAGGLGMTGVVEAVTVQLMPIVSSKLVVKTKRVDSLSVMLETFAEQKADAEYMIGWMDHTASGASLGRGIFEAANHVTSSDATIQTYKAPEQRMDIPFVAPSWLLNRYSMALYNHLRFRKVSKTPSTHEAAFDGFFHPLDSMGNWNRLYGKQGFLQYQVMVPEDKPVEDRLRTILTKIQEAGLFSFLAVIKYHRAHKGILSFSQAGYSLALDFPNNGKVQTLLDSLDEVVAGMGGRVYLAKDARMKRSVFEQMYRNELSVWKPLLKRYDPRARLQSSMSRRLGFKE